MQLRSRVKKEAAALAVATVPPTRSRSIKRAVEEKEEPMIKVEVMAAPSRRSRRRIKEEQVIIEAAVVLDQGGKVAVKKEEAGVAVAPSPRKKKVKQRAIREEPPKWREQLKGIEEMRSKKDAEVDAYGCEVWNSWSSATVPRCSLTSDASASLAL